MIYDDKRQDTGAGGSGCACSATVFASCILPRIEDGTWKRVLFVPTGALMSKVSFYEGQSVPGIAQAVILEHEGAGRRSDGDPHKGGGSGGSGMKKR